MTQLERQALYKQLTAAYSIVVNLATAVNEIMTAIKYLLRLFMERIVVLSGKRLHVLWCLVPYSRLDTSCC